MPFACLTTMPWSQETKTQLDCLARNKTWIMWFAWKLIPSIATRAQVPFRVRELHFLPLSHAQPVRKSFLEGVFWSSRITKRDGNIPFSDKLYLSIRVLWDIRNIYTDATDWPSVWLDMYWTSPSFLSLPFYLPRRNRCAQRHSKKKRQEKIKERGDHMTSLLLFMATTTSILLDDLLCAFLV